MQRTPTSDGRAEYRNVVLSSTSDGSLRTFRDELELVSLERGQLLSEPSRIPDYVYFPEGGIISLSVEMSGRNIDAGMIGREGISSYTALRKGRLPDALSTVQVGGAVAYRIPADRFRHAVERCPDLYDAIHDALYGLMGQIALTAAFNARHLLATRVARWLLLCAERLDGRTIPVTHDFLARVLGVQRTSVTTMLHLIEGQNAIKSRRGAVVIVDRHRLRRLAGEIV